MLTVLALELAVKAGIAGRTMQSEDAVSVEDVAHVARLVRPSAVHPYHQRSAVCCEVLLEGAGHFASFVALDDGHVGSVLDRAVAREEQHARPVGRRDVHLVEAPQDAGRSDDDALRACNSLTLHRHERLPFDGCTLPTREATKRLRERGSTDQPIELPHMVLDQSRVVLAAIVLCRSFLWPTP